MHVLARGFGVFALVLACTTAQALSDQNAQGSGGDAPAAAAQEAAPSPAEQHRALVDALIAGDIEAIAIQLSKDSQEELAREWESDRLAQAKSDNARYLDAGFERMWAALASPERTAELAAELHPQFVEQAHTSVAEFNDDLARALAALASAEEFSPSEVQQVSQLWLATQRWANGMDWQDRARFDRALAAAAAFVRRSGAQTASEIRLLPYEEAAAIGDDAVATVKRVLGEYDLDVDGMLASVEIEELARDGDTATMRWSARVLDVPIEIVREMRYDRKYSERWMTAKEFEQLSRWYEASEAEAATEAARAAAPATPSESQKSGDTGSCGKSAGATDAENQWWVEETEASGGTQDNQESARR